MTNESTLHEQLANLKRYKLFVGQPPDAHQILYGRLGRPHLGQHLFRWDAAVHHPGALGPAILGLDPLDEVAQRRLVRSVTSHHLVGQRQAIRRHDQRNDHLDAIRPLVPAVAKASLAGLRWVAFEIRAG